MPNRYDLRKSPNLSSDLRKLTGSSYGRGGGVLPSSFRTKGVAILVLCSLFIGFVLIDSMYTIEEGYVGLRMRYQRYLMDEVMPGTHFRIPFAERVQAVNVQARAIRYVSPAHSDTEEESNDPVRLILKGPIRALDRKGREVNAELMLSYRLKPRKAAEVVSKYGENWDLELLHPVVQDAVKERIGDFEAEQLAMRGEEAGQFIADALYKAISGVKGSPFHVSDIELIHLDMPTVLAEESLELRGEGGQEEALSELDSDQSPRQSERAAPPIEKKSTAKPDQEIASESTSDESGSISMKVELHFCRFIQKEETGDGRVSWDLVGMNDEFDSDVGKVTCYSRITGAEDDRVITHRWFREDQLVGEVALMVRSADWRTYSEKTILPHQRGKWRVDIVDSREGAVLATGNFVVR